MPSIQPINHCTPIRAFQICNTLTSCLHNSSLVIESKKQKEEKLITRWTHALSSIDSPLCFTEPLWIKPPYFPLLNSHLHNSSPPTYLSKRQHAFFLKSCNPFRDSQQRSQVLIDFYKNQMLPAAPSQLIWNSQPSHT